MKKYIYLLILSLVYGEPLHSQLPDPLSFFPHHKGDVWEYVDWWGRNPEQNIILKDTLGPDGKYYLETTMFGKMCIDTTIYEVRSNKWGGFTYNTLLLKLDADSGNTWIADSNEFRIYKAIVVDVYQMYVFGHIVTVKEIDYVESTSGLLFDTYYIAGRFGVIRQDIDTYPVMVLRGAIINGIKYGTVDVNDDNNNKLPISFELYQNYPNPFNPNTRISFDLPKQRYVTLKIYDVLGREIVTLVNELKEPGNYTVEWKAGNYPSGVYFYKLQAGPYINVKKMLLAK